MDLEFSGELWFWRGPAPWYFITVPEEDGYELVVDLGPVGERTAPQIITLVT